MSYAASMTVLSFACAMILALDFAFATIARRTNALSAYAARVSSLLGMRFLGTALIVVISAAVMTLLNNKEFVYYNNYSYLARALLHGRLDVPDMPGYLESVSYGGRTYMHLAPGPTLLVLPFVALFGMRFNLSILSIAIGALNVGIFHSILRRLKFDSLATRLWLTGLFGFGTVHFFLATLGHSWFFGHVCATFFILLALLSVLGRGQHPWRDCVLTGLFYGLATACRLPLLLSGPFFALLLWKYRRLGPRAVLYFALGALVPGGLYMLYNYVRFDTVVDLGYYLAFKKDHPTDPGGPLQLKYVPFNLYSLFILAPEYVSKFPFIRPSTAGVALTFSTPAFYYAVRAKAKPWFLAALWVTVFLTAIPFLMNWGNGMDQFGMRYSMDFAPFLLILTALALKNLDMCNKVVITICIWANTWGILYWNLVHLK